MVIKPDGVPNRELWGRIEVDSISGLEDRRVTLRIVIDDGARESDAILGLEEAEAWLMLMLMSVRRAKEGRDERS